MKPTPSSTGALVLLLAAGAWLCAGGCLNPRPEELPSSAPGAETPGGVDFGGDRPGAAAAEDPQTPADGHENNDPTVPPVPNGIPPSTPGGNTASDAGAPDASPEPDPEAVEAPE